MAILIDPSLSMPNLSQVVNICKDNPRHIVLTCLSPIQQKYLCQKISNGVKCLGTDWPVRERIDSFNSLYSYWDKLEKLEEAKISPWPSIFPYEINVAKIYRSYLVHRAPLFWLVLEVLTHKPIEWEESNLIAIGKNPMFFAAVDSASNVFNKLIRQKIFLKTNSGKKYYLEYIKKALELVRREVVLGLHGGKKLFIEKHRQTIPLFPYLKKQGIRYFHNSYFMIRELLATSHYRRQIERAADYFHTTMIDLFSKFPLKEKDLLTQRALKDFIHALDSDIRKAIFDGFFTWKGLDSIKADAALCINWFGTSHQFIRNWCRENKRPFMVLQHGFYRGGVVSPPEKIIDADVFLCWGPEMRESFIEADLDNEQATIEVVGNPVYDRNAIISEKLFQRNSLPKEHLPYTILAAPSGGSFLARDCEDIFWKVIESAMAHFPQIKWIIKCHDLYQFKDEVKKRFTKLGAIFSQAGNIFDAMRSCHLVVSDISTVPLDAMVARKPVIIFNLLDMPERFSEFGAGIIIKETGAFCNQLEKLVKMKFFDPELMKRQKRFVAAFSEPGSINNIVNSINRIISREYASKKERNRS